MSEETPAVQTVQTLNIQIDRSKITLGDMRFMIRANANKGSLAVEDMARVFDFLDKVVIGGIEDIPFDATEQVMEAVFSQMSAEKAKN